MGNFRLSPFHVTDLAVFPGLLEKLNEQRPGFRVYGDAYTARVDDVIVGCGGIIPVRPGVGEAWVVLSSRLNGSGGRVARVVRHSVDKALANGFRRIQATSDARNGPASRFLEFLGFECEGVLRQFGHDGSDHFMWSRVKP